MKNVFNKNQSPRLPLSRSLDVVDELGDNLENETAKDSSIDDKTNQVDNNLDGSSSKALPRSRFSWVLVLVNRVDSLDSILLPSFRR